MQSRRGYCLNKQSYVPLHIYSKLTSAKSRLKFEDGHLPSPSRSSLFSGRLFLLCCFSLRSSPLVANSASFFLLSLVHSPVAFQWNFVAFPFLFLALSLVLVTKILPPFLVSFLLSLALLISKIAPPLSISFLLPLAFLISQIAPPFSLSLPLLVSKILPPFSGSLLLSLSLSLACLPPTFSFSLLLSISIFQTRGHSW